MRRITLAALVVFATLATGVPAQAEPIVINPFGTLTVAVTREPTLLDPGAARLTINTGSGAAFSGGSTIYFGLRIMGTEDVEMT